MRTFRVTYWDKEGNLHRNVEFRTYIPDGQQNAIGIASSAFQQEMINTGKSFDFIPKKGVKEVTG